MLAPRPEFVARPEGPGEFWERMAVREARSRLRPKVAHRAEPDTVLHRGPTTSTSIATRAGYTTLAAP